MMQDIVTNMSSGTRSVKRTLADLDEAVKTRLDEEHWDGVAKYAFAVCKANWDNAANNMSVLLDQLVEMLNALIQAFRQTNKAVIQMWRLYAR